MDGQSGLRGNRSGLIIFGRSGSTAEAFAREYDCFFVPMEQDTAETAMFHFPSNHGIHTRTKKGRMALKKTFPLMLAALLVFLLFSAFAEEIRPVLTIGDTVDRSGARVNGADQLGM